MSEHQQTGTLIYKVMARSPLQRGKATCRGEYGTPDAAKRLVAELREGASPNKFRLRGSDFAAVRQPGRGAAMSSPYLSLPRRTVEQVRREQRDKEAQARGLQHWKFNRGVY